MFPLQVRQADVVAEGPAPLQCYTLSRRDFLELLGSTEEVWKFEHLKEVRTGSIITHGAYRASAGWESEGA